MTEFVLFVSSFSIVFVLGFQSLSVQNGHMAMAAVNSVALGFLNLILFKTVPTVQSMPEIAAYIIGGPVGIVTAMWVHKRFR